MGRSVSYLSRAIRIAYFEYPKVESYNEDASLVIEDIQESIKSEFPEFSNTNEWDGNEDHIILEGYRTQIGLSEYCGLATLSIRVDESVLEYSEDDEDSEKQRAEITDWIEKSWKKISLGYNQYERIGGFSNGESFYQAIKTEKNS